MSVSRVSLLFSYRLFFRAAPIAASLLLLSTILIGLFPGAQAFLLTSLVGELTNTAPHSNLWGLPVAFVWLSIVSMLQMFTGLTNQLAFNYAKNKLNTSCTELILRKMPRIATGMFEREDIYDQLYRAKTNVESPFEQIRTFHAVGSIVISLISFLLYVRTLNAWLSLLFVVSILLYSVQMFVQSKVEHTVYLEQVTEERELNYLAEVLSQKAYGKEVRIFQLLRYVYERWLELSERLVRQYLRVRQKHHLQNMLTTTSGFAIVAIFFVVVALSVRAGSTSTAAFAGLVSFIGQLGYMIANVGRQTRDYNLTRLKVRSVIEFLQGQEAVAVAAAPQLTEVQGYLQLRNVSFRYPGAEACALQDIDLEIAPGETIGIVGENGSGKTTLAHLLAGLLTPTRGELWLDGVRYEQLDKAVLAQHIGVVHQKPVRYELSFQENIALCSLQTEQLDAVLREFELHEVLDKLPQALDTLLGKSFGTVDLSGGEWQRLAIARCFLRSPSLYILDEPTSALDPENESYVFSLFRQLAADKTTVIISHRLGSIKGVDKIIVLKQGRIVETGTHHELIAQAGEYQRLYDLQAQWYQEGE